MSEQKPTPPDGVASKGLRDDEDTPVNGVVIENILDNLRPDKETRPSGFPVVESKPFDRATEGSTKKSLTPEELARLAELQEMTRQPEKQQETSGKKVPKAQVLRPRGQRDIIGGPDLDGSNFKKSAQPFTVNMGRRQDADKPPDKKPTVVPEEKTSTLARILRLVKKK